MAYLELLLVSQRPDACCPGWKVPGRMGWFVEGCLSLGGMQLHKGKQNSLRHEFIAVLHVTICAVVI